MLGSGAGRGAEQLACMGGVVMQKGAAACAGARGPHFPGAEAPPGGLLLAPPQPTPPPHLLSRRLLDEAWEVYCWMLADGLSPDRATYSRLISVCAYAAGRGSDAEVRAARRARVRRAGAWACGRLRQLAVPGYSPEAGDPAGCLLRSDSCPSVWSSNLHPSVPASLRLMGPNWAPTSPVSSDLRSARSQLLAQLAKQAQPDPTCRRAAPDQPPPPACCPPAQELYQRLLAEGVELDAFMYLHLVTAMASGERFSNVKRVTWLQQRLKQNTVLVHILPKVA